MHVQTAVEGSATRVTDAVVSDAAVWEAGARAEFEDLLELIRAGQPGIEQLVMPRLAIVGAALMHSLGARRQEVAAPASRRASRRRRSARTR